MALGLKQILPRNMDLLTFFTQESILNQHSIYCFVGTEYQSLFFSILKQKLKEKSNFITIDALTHEAELKAHLEMSFLGSNSFYWLSSELIETHKWLIPYLINYKGPNQVGFFSKKSIASTNDQTWITIDIPATVNDVIFTNFFTYLYQKQPNKSSSIIRTIFKKHSSINLDTALLLMHYYILLGNKPEAFIEEWLSAIILPEKSLFSLSTYFFAKKEQLFFELWNRVSSDYSEPFWTTFWSEQLFKAHAYITLNNKQDFLQAKKVAYRLPFSFMQKDWKLLSLEELSKTHNHIYSLDWNIKNGLSAHFEHFYLNFFLNKFR